MKSEFRLWVNVKSEMDTTFDLWPFHDQRVVFSELLPMCKNQWTELWLCAPCWSQQHRLNVNDAKLPSAMMMIRDDDDEDEGGGGDGVCFLWPVVVFETGYFLV